jgi:hypothetical protein
MDENNPFLRLRWVCVAGSCRERKEEREERRERGRLR